MKYFKLPQSNIFLKPQNISIQQNSDITPYVNHSLCKYLYKSKQLIHENSEHWDIFKKYTNIYEFIHTPYGYKQYVSKLKPLSRAYYKMIEIMNHFDILQKYTYKILIVFI